MIAGDSGAEVESDSSSSLISPAYKPAFTADGAVATADVTADSFNGKRVGVAGSDDVGLLVASGLTRSSERPVLFENVLNDIVDSRLLTLC